MKRQGVNSSAIRSVGYDATHKMMEIEFISGVIYKYFDVPPAEYHALLKAESPGTIFNEQIKDAYRTTKIG